MQQADEITVLECAGKASANSSSVCWALERNEVLIREFNGQDDHLLGIRICMPGVALADL